MPVRYDAIFEWNMTSAEVAAYKLAVLYEQEYLSIFKGDMCGQDFRRNTLPKRGDPRKSNLFRYCWKLRRETRGLLELGEYRQYVRANLTILKLNKAHVEPNGICGDKAWIRWKVYERWYKNKIAEINATQPPPNISSINSKLIKEIDQTKKFLFEKCDGEVTKEKILKFADDGFLKFWIMSGKVSKVYVSLSPYLKDYRKILADSCEFDLVLINQRVTDDVKEYFQYEYSHERLDGGSDVGGCRKSGDGGTEHPVAI